MLFFFDFFFILVFDRLRVRNYRTVKVAIEWFRIASTGVHVSVFEINATRLTRLIIRRRVGGVRYWCDGVCQIWPLGFRIEKKFLEWFNCIMCYAKEFRIYSDDDKQIVLIFDRWLLFCFCVILYKNLLNEYWSLNIFTCVCICTNY